MQESNRLGIFSARFRMAPYTRNTFLNDHHAVSPSPFLKGLVTGVILAGGQGSRMGGVDKGWVEFEGKPLINHVLSRLSPQTEHVVIVANRNLERYRLLGVDVVSDEIQGFQGPLAGIHAGLSHITTPLALIVPTDAPLLPLNLLQHLADNARVDAALDHPVLSHDGEREQPLFGIFPKRLATELQRFLESDQRRLMQWCRQQGAEWVDFSAQKEAFANMNSPAQLTRD